ncbi:MAG TPA: hypothetical protein VJU60_02325 [Thermoleophilaceae bacterium]|nr:hypothetical protein [Thermoleophilaceae bacterium]
MAFQLIPVNGLRVEGRSEAPDVGEFSGPVIAMGVQDSDPIAAVAPESEAAHTREGLDGRGTTYFLVCDESKPQPVWVAKHDVESHTFN